MIAKNFSDTNKKAENAFPGGWRTIAERYVCGWSEIHVRIQSFLNSLFVMGCGCGSLGTKGRCSLTGSHVNRANKPHKPATVQTPTATHISWNGLTSSPTPKRKPIPGPAKRRSIPTC